MDKIRRKNAQKVICAMSGGIDSSVAAALLKRVGPAPEKIRYGVNFDVTGVFLRLADLPRFRESEKRAKKVAKILGIPFLVLDLRKEFKKRIVDYFLDGYKKGITPNPCVVCNKEIKFGLLLEKALALNADYVATGHYARLRNSYIRKKFVFRSLIRAKDKNKDQSYFLWMLNQEQLKRILFPIGDYTREEVEKLAKKFKLPVLKAKKSVEICFIQTTINDFLARHLKQKPGQILCSNSKFEHSGKIIGEHQGLAFYTIGQRKGIGLPGGPFYVLDKDLKKNLLIVTKNEKDLLKKELICQNVNWIPGKEPRLLGEARPKGAAKLPLRVKAKIRYRHKAATAIISHRLRSKVYSLKFKVAQRAITPGQSVVFYLPVIASAKAGKGEERGAREAGGRGGGVVVLGGGIIC